MYNPWTVPGTLGATICKPDHQEERLCMEEDQLMQNSFY
jgi:hypothetical protein